MCYFAMPLLMLLFSCQNPQHQSSADIHLSEYLMLKPGNYWIYQSFYVDSNGKGEPGFYNGEPAFYDSSYVAPDTTFGGHTWHVLMTPEPVPPGRGPYFFATYLRDSMRYVVDNFGRKVLGPPGDTSTLYTWRGWQAGDSVSTLTIQMSKPGEVVTVPAGSFTTIGYTITNTLYFNALSHKQPRILKMHARYAHEIGLVLQSYPSVLKDPMNAEKRLVRWHVR